MESSCQFSRPEVLARAPRYRRAPKRRGVALPADWKAVAPPPPGKGRGAKVAGLAGTVLVHLSLVALIVTAGRTPRQPEAQQPVEFEVVEKAPPPPEPPKVEEPKKVEPPKVARAERPKPPPRPAPRDAPPPPPDVPDAPPPPNDAPPPDAAPRAPIMIGMSLSSTTAAGGFAAPVGNTLYGEAPKEAPRPEDVKAYAAPAGRYVPPYKATRLPVLKREVKASYPEEARRLGLEGQVVLRLTIDAEGKVAQIKVLRSAGHGFDEAALEAMRRTGWDPGLEGTDKISTEITFTYTFVLD